LIFLFKTNRIFRTTPSTHFAEFEDRFGGLDAHPYADERKKKIAISRIPKITGYQLSKYVHNRPIE